VRGKIIRIAKIFQVFGEYAQDIWLFLRHNGFSPFEEQARRLSHKTIIEAHTIEKGLALPRPKPHFGQDKIKALLDMNKGWTPPANDLSRSMLLGALRDYRTTFAAIDPPSPALAQDVARFLEQPETAGAAGGVTTHAGHEIARNAQAIDFLGSRFSARDFGPEPLSAAQVRDVVELAQKAPSQCNRQSVRLHVYRDRAMITRLLELQGGARGFMEVVPTLFVVTSEITAWGGPQQRNQLYVDGGIYTTMLLLALGAHGFASCPLNLAVTNGTERKIKATGGIPGRERLVVMIAAGSPPEGTLRAARSPRWAADAVLSLHD
jgi:nitroreductase